ncbi:hypothetical protein [Streptomyces sp. NPDC002088]|uniref:hypothetical protein n=1 Tax=Streptomyces sp. NPDC002088 TaxID=3154665 RepID=UPI00331DD025
MASQSTQLSAAIALVQLLTERPDLSEHMSWTVSRTSPVLVGYIHDGGVQVLDDCMKFLGGSVRADHTYEIGGERMRQHVLTSTWRDVRVEVLLSLPVAAEAVAA